MKLLPRFLRREEPEETRCPRCGVPAPAGSVECNACGWDMRDANQDPLARESTESAQH